MRFITLPAAVVILTTVLLSERPAAAQPQLGATPALRDNAALRYWQAFAHLPVLDERQQKFLASAGAEAVDPETKKLVEDGRDALLYLTRGAAITPCDWGLHPEDGPYLLLPHLAKGRDLARLACANARLDAVQGEFARVADGAADAITLGRHLGGDLTAIISYLVQLGIERMAIDALAPHLLGLDARSLDQLARRLESLPPGGSVDECLRVERESFLEWAVSHLRAMKDSDPWQERIVGPFASEESKSSKDKLDGLVAAVGGTREAVLKNFEALRHFYDELDRIVKLPRAEFRAKFAELEKSTQGNPIAASVIPAMPRVYDKDAAGRTRMTMLKAAVAVARGGVERARAFKDANGESIECHETADGFELRSTVVDEDAAVILKIGGRKTQRPARGT